MKVNYLGIAGGILAFACLIMPWWTISMATARADVERGVSTEFTLFLYQLTGEVTTFSDRIIQTTTTAVWFNLATIVLLIVAGVSCISGSLLAGKRGRNILFLGGILALVSLAVFGSGLMASNFANSLMPGYAMDFFPAGSFRVTSQTLMDYTYDYSWNLSYGFWLALASGLVTLVSFVATREKTKKPQ